MAGSFRADGEGFAGGFDNFFSHCVELVDLQDALDLGDEAAGEDGSCRR